MTVKPYEPAHLRALLLQPAQAFLADALQDDGTGERIRQMSDAYTALDGDRVLACGGVMELDPGHGMAWGILAADLRHHMVGITRAVRRRLRASGMRRIQIQVKDDFAAGHLWARLLGFKDETPNGMPEYRPGENYHLYAWVRHG